MLFTKMHGLGNDFIIIEDLTNRYMDYGSIALQLCDRHFGIGADGLLVVKSSDVADSKMLIFNSDGSEAEMCGNGIRCFAKYLYDNGMVSGDNIDIETPSGVKKVRLHSANNSVVSITVDMGSPDFRPERIPIRIDKDMIVGEVVEIDGQHYRITSMLMDIPHTVIFVDKINLRVVESLGRKIENNWLFPKKTNVNFVKVIDRNKFYVRTWERGAGLTLACGTGACASLVACVLNDKTERKAIVCLPGGEMVIDWHTNGDVYMTGPAETVFTGEYKLI